MRSNASFAALFLLAGCAGHGGYSELSGASAAPTAGARDDGYYAASEPRDPEARPARVAYQQPAQPAQDAYAQPPRLADPYAAPTSGAPYARPAESDSVPQQADADPAASAEGPRGSSQHDGAEQRYDEVGYAGVRGVAGGEANGGAVVVIARSVPVGSFVEITSLENGKTIVALVTGTTEGDHPLDLSPAAARQLGASGSSIPIRVRKVSASAADQAALRAGQAATDRPDTPPVLLNALRKHLPGGPPVADYDPGPAPTARPPAAPVRQPVRAAPARGGYYVQVAALSNGANAQGLARSVGGFVKPGGGLYRVQMGPYRTAGEAEAARANAARRGYGDARVFTQ